MKKQWVWVLAASLAWGCSSTEGEGGGGGGVDDPASYAETLMAAGWASDMTLALDGEELTIGDDGIPDHDLLEAYASPDGGDPIVVTASAYTVTGLGTIGVAISGGVFFNPYEGDGTTVALDSNFEVDGAPFIDACSGHPLPSGGSYHYHGTPYCITDVIDTEGQHSALLGVLLDGFPVYGPRDEGGAAPTDLDGCSGPEGPTPEFPDGIYHYHITETAPYMMTCYSGEVDASAGGGGGPGGGGPPGGGPPS